MSTATNEPRKPHKVKHYNAGVFFSDFATAAMVGFAAAIPISAIDYSIISKVAGVAENNSSLKELSKAFKTILFRPHKYFLPCAENKYAKVYGACTSVYFLTYLFSNTAKSTFESQHYTPEKTNLAAGVFSGIVNILMTVWKDGIILKALPPKSEADRLLALKPVPLFSRSLFAVRDMITCIAAFTIAPVVGAYLAASPAYKQSGSPLTANDAGQIITPASLQVLTTLIHITAIRYQRKEGLVMSDLADAIKANYISATLLRVTRIVPAFGIGGIFNRETRWKLLDKYE